MFKKYLDSWPMIHKKMSGQSAGRNSNASGTGSVRVSVKELSIF